jgi:hypothetical protein
VTFDLREKDMSEDELYESGTSELILTTAECDTIRTGMSGNHSFLSEIEAVSPDQEGNRKFVLTADELIELTFSICAGSLVVQKDLFAIDDKIITALRRLKKESRTKT